MSATGDEVAAGLVDTWAQIVQASDQANVRELGGAHLLVTGIELAGFNSIMFSRADAPLASVVEVLEDLDGTGLPRHVEVRPGQDRAVAELVAKAGYALGAQIPLMVLEDGQRPVNPPSLATRVAGPADRDAIVEVCASSFEMPRALVEGLLPPRVFDNERVTAYLGLDGERPVATACGIQGDGCVGVYCVATLPTHRGRGFGAALTARAVHDGFERGARRAVLQASPLGRPVYERLGFVVLEEWASWSNSEPPPPSRPPAG